MTAPVHSLPPMRLARRRPYRLQTTARLLACCATLAISGSCGSDSPASPPGPTRPGTENPQAPAAPAPRPKPVYVVAVDQHTDENRIAYITTVSSLEAGNTVSLDRAIEFPGGANIFGRPKEGSFYVTPWEKPVIERWDVAADGALTKRDEVSVVQLGLSSASNAAYAPMYSANKSYFMGEDGLVAWNPATMEILGTFPIPAEYVTYRGEGPFTSAVVDVRLVRDDLIQLGVIWEDPSTWGHWAESSTLIDFDPKSGTYTGAHDELRCEHMVANGVKTSDGTTYFSSDPAYQLLERAYGSENGARACALRMTAPDNAFDPNFFVDPSKLAGGRPAGVVTPVSDTLAYISVFHPELFGAEISADNYESLWLEDAPPAFRIWKWRIGDATAEEISDQEATPYGIGGEQSLKVDDRVFALDLARDLTSWKLMELRPDGTIAPALAGPHRAALGIIHAR